MANGVGNASLIFNVVFLCTIVSLIIQGSSLSAMARSLHLAEPAQEKNRLFHFDIDLPEDLENYVQEKQITPDMLEKGNCLKDMVIPANVRVLMLRRGENFSVPRGSTPLKEGDWLLVISEEDMEQIQQTQEQEDDYALNEWGMQLINHTGFFFRNTWKRIKGGKDYVENA
jgi:cell volume regulation protein A